MYLDRRQEDEERIPTRLLRASTQRANKVHWCTNCAKDIVPGEQYRAVVLLVDGEFEYYRYCPMCIREGEV